MTSDDALNAAKERLRKRADESYEAAWCSKADLRLVLAALDAACRERDEALEHHDRISLDLLNALEREEKLREALLNVALNYWGGEGQPEDWDGMGQALTAAGFDSDSLRSLLADSAAREDER